MKLTCLFALLASFITVSIAQEDNSSISIPAMMDGASVITHSLETKEQTTNHVGDTVIPVVQTVESQLTTVYFTIVDVSTLQDVSTEAIWVEHPNLAKALRNPDAFERFIEKAIQENPEYAQEFDAMIEEESIMSLAEAAAQVSAVSEEE